MKNKKKLLIAVCVLLAAALICAVIALRNTQCTAHTDADQDDICDRCGSSVLVYIDFYCVNDLHGRVLDSSSQPGIDEMTTYFQQAALTDDHVILLSAGDMWQGSAESNLTKGKMVTQWMSELDFAAMAMGNHEYDWGEGYIEENAEFAEFPFLAINIYDADTDALVDYCAPSLLVTCDSVQVGIIGAIGDCYSSIASEMVQDVYFKTGAELTALVQAESEALRQQGADFIVYLLHDGLGNSAASSVVTDRQLASYYDPSLSDGAVDLVFEAHTHQRYLLEDSRGVLHLQNGGDNSGGISHVEIAIHTVNGTASVTQAQLISGSVYEDLEDAPLVSQLLEKYEAEIAPALTDCGTLKHAVTGDVLRQAVADLYYLEGLVRWGGEYPIALAGGFISIRNPGYLPAGEVTYSQLMELFPFDNELVLCSIQGRDLIERFLHSDDSRYFISTDPELTENIDPEGIYYVVVDTYSSTYGPNRLTEIERYGEAVYARDLLAEYIRNGGLG